MNARLIILLNFLFNFVLHGQVVINEINVNPAGGTSSTIQSVKVCTASTSGNEYIELYNKSDCPVDISCYFIGWNQGTNALNGSFRFPSGTTIPAKGFLSVGGPNSSATINFYSYCSTTNLNTGNTRWYLNNGDGYVCLYNTAGVAIDLVYWTFSSGETSKYGTDSEISDGPTFIANPAGCTVYTGTMLPGPSSIGIGSGIVSYAGAYPSSPAVLGRTIDGGATWTNTLSISVNNCNGTCNTVGSCILPIELNKFTVTCNENERIFEWETLSERNNKMFVIEQSTDGYNYTELTNIKGGNNSSIPISYNASFPINNEYKYFRLKQIDFNAHFSVLKTIYSDCTKNNSFLSLYPNPFENSLTFTLSLKNESPFALMIYDVNGRLVYSYEDKQATFKKVINLNELSDGIYICVIMIGDEIKSKTKIIKTKP